MKVETVWLENQDIFRDEPRRGLILEILEKFPETEIDDLKVKSEAPKVYLEKMIEILRDNYFLDLSGLPGLEERISNANQKLFDKRKREIDLRALKLEQNGKKRKKGITSIQSINWRDFDLNLDFNLDDEEIKIFVSALEKNPNMLFKSENYETKPNKNHPSFRSRILFVFHVAKEWHIIQTTNSLNESRAI